MIFSCYLGGSSQGTGHLRSVRVYNRIILSSAHFYAIVDLADGKSSNSLLIYIPIKCLCDECAWCLDFLSHQNPGVLCTKEWELEGGKKEETIGNVNMHLISCNWIDIGEDWQMPATTRLIEANLAHIQIDLLLFLYPHRFTQRQGGLKWPPDYDLIWHKCHWCEA